MKVHIKDGETKRKFSLWVPTSILKWKWIYSLIIKYSKDDTSKKITNLIKNNSKKFYKILKKYIKANGHFTLVDIESADGDIVKIIV